MIYHLTLPLPTTSADEVWKRGGSLPGASGQQPAHLNPALLGAPPDAGMGAMQQAEKPEDENGFATL